MFSFINNWRENNSERIIRFFVFGFLIFLLLWQGINLYGRQQEKVLPDNYNKEFEEAILWLKDNTRPDDIILAEWTQGHQIVALANRRVVATSKVYPSEAQETAGRYEDIARFFFADCEEDALKILQKYKANFIFVRRNFDWWTCRSADKCQFQGGFVVNRMLEGDKFNNFSLAHQSSHSNFFIFKAVFDLKEKKLFAGFPEESFKGFIEQKSLNSASEMKEMVSFYGAILPHHLPYVGQALADFFQNLSKVQRVENFIILGPDHFDLANSSVTVSNISWETPNGEVKPNLKIVGDLVGTSEVNVDNRINEREHALKVLVPFIQYYFPRAQVIPIIIKNNLSAEKIADLADILKKFISKKTVILVSSDFAHHFSLEKTEEKDRQSFMAIQNLNPLEIQDAETDAKSAISILVSLMKKIGATQIKTLEHTNNLEIIRQGIWESESKSVPYLVSYFFITFSQSDER